MYDNNGSKIKYPKGFFSQLTANERGQWTNRTKKQYNIGPYSLDDEETVNARIDHRRTREAENKRKQRERDRFTQLLSETLGQTAKFKQRPTSEVKYSSAHVRRLLKEYGKKYYRNSFVDDKESNTPK